jgi:hypothetical protein
MPILVEKIGINKVAYAKLLQDALNSHEGDELHALGEKLRISLSNLLPNGQQDTSPDALGAGEL